MKVNQKIVIFCVVIVAVVTGFAVYLVARPSDRCTADYWQSNNCVPAGRCTPPGDPREYTTDCALKEYDHKFSTRD